MGDFDDSLFEGFEGGAVCRVHGHEDEGFEGETEGVCVQLGVVPNDRAGVFQCPQSAVARRDAESDAIGKLGDRKPAILLQFGKNFSVCTVHVEDSPPEQASTGKL